MVKGLTTLETERKMLLDAEYGDPAINYYLEIKYNCIPLAAKIINEGIKEYKNLT